MPLAVIALGSNLGSREDHLRAALDALGRLGTITRRSSLYETPPVGPPQPNYLNAIVLVETALEPATLLGELLAIERTRGRIRDVRWGPRTLDLDLVAYGDRAVSQPGLHVPHPEAHRRAFVLVPLAEVAPSLVLPGHGRVDELLRNLPEADRRDVRAKSLTWTP